MDYIFGTVFRRGELRLNLKTKGDHHSNLKGFCVYQREDSDRREEHRFRVVERYLTAEDIEGNCYDWYIIDQYAKDTDRFSPVKEQMETDITDSQDALIEIADMIAEQSDALMELASILEG